MLGHRRDAEGRKEHRAGIELDAASLSGSRVGKNEVNGKAVGTLDGVAITRVATVKITALEDSELVMVDAG